MDEDTMLALVGNMPAVLVRQQRYYAVRWLRRRAEAPLLGGGEVPTGGPERGDGPLSSPALDEEMAALQAAQDGAAEATLADRMVAALGPAGERAIVAEQTVDGVTILDELADNFDAVDLADGARAAGWSPPAPEAARAAILRAAGGLVDDFSGEDQWLAGSGQREGNKAAGARAGRPRRVWEEDEYGTAS